MDVMAGRFVAKNGGKKKRERERKKKELILIGEHNALIRESLLYEAIC